jgi:hypothetical protein
MTATTATSPAKIGWLAALSPRFLGAPSVIVLIAANLLPLYGVLYGGWDLFSLMLLYWMETGIIGFFAIIQMALQARWHALFLVPFFIVHFGGFMYGHFLFLSAFFGGGFRVSGISGVLWDHVTRHGLWLALIALFISHLVSFIVNVLRPMWHLTPGHSGIEHRQPLTDAQQVMMAPYGRIVVMHVTIIFGAMLSVMFNTKTAAYVLLIALKIVVDVAAHVRRNFSPAPTAV